MNKTEFEPDSKSIEVYLTYIESIVLVVVIQSFSIIAKVSPNRLDNALGHIDFTAIIRQRRVAYILQLCAICVNFLDALLQIQHFC